MPDQPDNTTFLPDLVPQNPAPIGDSQGRKDVVRDQVDHIMAVFSKVLPSNYIDQVSGSFHSLQFQAMAERIADFQVTAQEVFVDSFHEYTRPEFLWQIIGALVFPDAKTDGWPKIEGDLSYREFVRRMVELLLQGSKKETLQEGMALLTDATVEIIECGIEARKLKGKSAWGPDEQFTFEINISQENGTVDVDGVQVPLWKFPDDPFTLFRNAQIVLRALKPGHTLYDWRYLFRETFGALFTDTWSFTWEDYHYQDFRRWWLGAARMTGSSGTTLSDRTLFSDTTRDFTAIKPGATLRILDGVNSVNDGKLGATNSLTEEEFPGYFRVVEIRTFPVGDDPTPRAYTTTPSGLSGTATVEDGNIVDLFQNWALVVEGEILTFSAGPNAGNYRLKTLIGLHGGPIGVPTATGPSTKVRPAPSLLRVRRRMKMAVSGQSWEVVVDRLGMQTPRRVSGEDATPWFVR
jgi:hypothetical protein